MPEIRIMTENDFDFAVEMTEREQWFHQRHDFQRLTAFEPRGCFIAWENDDRVGMVCSTSQQAYAFLSCLIVKEGHRGQRIGEALMRHAIDYQRARGAETIELDGVIPALPLYRRLGFRDKYLSLRFRRPPDTDSPAPVATATSMTMEALVDYDHRRTGLNRGRILSRFYDEFADFLFAVQANSLGGYAFVRPRANDSMAIGPLVADSPAIAGSILPSIIKSWGHKTLAIGVPEINRESVSLVLQHGFLYTEPSLRMYLGKQLSYERSVFAILSPEKG
ncbi:MAG: GNAT family N-acetyltransferase [candidate division Zixibacteria bacterium]|nr:GNAT family N-acetyltransferase [candidate division Zixibacteria bacterium]